MSNCLEATQFFLSPCCELSHIGLLYGYFVQLVGTLSCLNWICYQECWGRLWVLAGVEGTTVDVSRGGGDDHGEKDLAGKCFSFLLLSTGSGHPILCPGHTKLCIVRKWWPCISLRLPPAISVNSIFVCPPLRMQSFSAWYHSALFLSTLEGSFTTLSPLSLLPLG